MTPIGPSRIEEGWWRFDATAKPAFTPAMLAAKAAAVLARRRTERDAAQRQGERANEAGARRHR